MALEKPRAGVDYPATHQQLLEWFPNGAACEAFLEALRWRNGFCCPGCGESGYWRSKDGSFICGSCRRRTSVTAGTIFHHSRLPLTTWFAAVWFVTSQKNGVQRDLGLGSYETAW